MEHFARFAVLLSLVSALSACGGGGNVETIPTTGVSIARFVGKWQNIDPQPVCDQFPQSDFYYSESTMVLITNVYSESYDYYSDAACTSYLGSSYSAFDIEWSLPTVAETKKGAIRARIFNPTYSASGEIRPPAITSDPTVSYKVLFYADSNTLSSYFDVASPDLDDEGYPLGDGLPLFTYSAK